MLSAPSWREDHCKPPFTSIVAQVMNDLEAGDEIVSMGQSRRRSVLRIDVNALGEPVAAARLGRADYRSSADIGRR